MNLTAYTLSAQLMRRALVGALADDPVLDEPRATRHLPRRLLAAVTRAHAREGDGERVHFHAGDHGRPYVCEERRCNSPRLHVACS
jgi:phosphopantetheinyl transferase